MPELLVRRVVAADAALCATVEERDFYTGRNAVENLGAPIHQARGMWTTRSGPFRTSRAEGTLSQAIYSLLVAEREVLTTIVRGPLQRFLRSDAFALWASSALLDIQALQSTGL